MKYEFLISFYQKISRCHIINLQFKYYQRNNNKNDIIDGKPVMKRIS